MATKHYCVQCSKIVSSCMHAVSCDICERWQHRKCGTGISLQDYRLMCKGELQLEWKCVNCSESANAKDSSVEVSDDEKYSSDENTASEKDSNVQEPVMDMSDIFDSSDYFEDFTDLDFEIEKDFGDKFILDDIKFEGMRHLIFVKKDQLELIRESRRWFIGGTYKMVQHPFVQLITIHRFVRSGDNSKQVPIVYIVLSRRRRSDYIKVLSCLKEHLGQPLVEAFMLDFDADLWEAVRHIFPGKIMKGCNFQWSTQVYRQIQKAGLSAEYKKKEGIYRCLRNFMCLPYLPTGHIKPSFEKLREFAASASEPVKRVISYIDTAWISSAQWGPENWSVYGQQVRTNNDVKGWHSRITGRAGWFKLPVYDLTELLFKEARWVDYEIRCVSEHMTSRYQRKKYVQINKELSRVWNDYAKHNITTSGLLREVSDITGTGR